MQWMQWRVLKSYRLVVVDGNGEAVTGGVECRLEPLRAGEGVPGVGQDSGVGGLDLGRELGGGVRESAERARWEEWVSRVVRVGAELRWVL